MLRRLPEKHKINACRLVPTLEEARQPGRETSFSEAKAALYRLPHDDGSVSCHYTRVFYFVAFAHLLNFFIFIETHTAVGNN
jgi:hypothetical protein